jgi:flagellar basal body P-ring formation protein FlgA
MIRFALVLLVLLACSAGAAAAELTLLPGAPLTPEAVADMVAADLRARGVGGQVAVEVSSPAAPIPNRATTPMRVVLSELRYDQRKGRYDAILTAGLRSGEAASIPTSGRVDQLVEVPVPARPIARGETLRPEDVTTGTALAASLPSDALRRSEDLVGQQASRPLIPGRAARAGDLVAPWLVRRGDDASMVFRRGALQIVGAAVVLENGRQGESVRVRNAGSGETRRAVVVGTRQVEVTDPGAVP